MEKIFQLPPLNVTDYSRHNEEQKHVWESYSEGNPQRVPMILCMNPRVLLCNPAYNTKRISFKEYINDPDTMRLVQCEFAYYIRHYVCFDHEMGMPEQWQINVDTQNIYEAAWFGAEIVYVDGDVPDTRPFLTDNNKEQLFHRGIPDPFSGIFGLVKRYTEYFNDKEYRFMGLPVKATPASMSTDGPMTVACNLRGATEFCIDLYEDEDYAMQLLEFITQATIRRIKAWRDYLGLETPDNFGFADDSISLLSEKDYERFILPFHKKLRENLTTGRGEKNFIHLCGDATRHFPLIQKELGVSTFDTGYPVDHGGLLRKLAPGTEIFGGPTVGVLKNGTPKDVEAETIRILKDVMPWGKKFILRDANNLPPFVPAENIAKMYETVREYGRYS